jgi:prephenate dehydrogenase
VTTPAASPSAGEARTLHVIGAGLIGTSVALAAARSGWTVTLEDADADRAGHATDLLALASGGGPAAGRSELGPVETSGEQLPVPPAGAGPALVCVAVPPRLNGLVLVDALRHYVESTVMDVCSIKSSSQADVEASDEDLTRLVWTHPMAGAEGSGPQAARADLFDGRSWIVCTTADEGGSPLTSGARACVERLIADCGARPLMLSVARHDELLAMTSHLPQLVASALASEVVAAFAPGPAGAAAELPPPSLLAGPGLLDMTRIAASPSELWAQIAALNRQPVRDGLRLLTGRLQRLEAALDDPTSTARAVTDLVDDGRSARGVLDRKHAGAAGGRGDLAPAPDWTWVRATIADVPGTLARVFAVAGELGVNIEDVQVDHAPYASQGLVSVAVRSTDAERLAHRLES